MVLDKKRDVYGPREMRSIVLWGVYSCDIDGTEMKAVVSGVNLY